MNRAHHAEGHPHPATRAALVCAAAAILGQAGCAGGGDTWRAGASAMSSMIWSRGKAEPGYDLYAQNMAESKGVKDAQAAGLADRGPEAGTPAEPAADRFPSRVAADEPRPRTRTNADPSVRVTLGRPESLPVLKDLDGAPGPLMADAAPAPKPVAAEAPPAAPARRRAAEPKPEVVAVTPSNPEDADTRPVGDLALNGPAAAPIDPVPAPAHEPKAKAAEVDLKSLLDDARARLEAVNTYQVSITRSERVGNDLQPEEKALLSIRRNPKAVRLEWPEGANKGREVIYSAAVNDRLMHINMPNSPLSRMKIAVDHPLAMRNSRHAITEAGFDTIFSNLSGQIDAQGRPTGAGGRLTYKGLQNPEGVDRACHLIQRITPTKEVWRVYLDPENLMPVVVTAHQGDGALLEAYRYDDFRPDPTALASVEAFDPDKRWGEAKGLFSRLANAAGGAADQGAPSATR